jgi:hypothetical protein
MSRFAIVRTVHGEPMAQAAVGGWVAVRLARLGDVELMTEQQAAEKARAVAGAVVHADDLAVIYGLKPDPAAGAATSDQGAPDEATDVPAPDHAAGAATGDQGGPSAIGEQQG